MTDSQEKSAPAGGAGAQAESKENAKAASLPAIDFSTFVLSLSTSALYQMGLVNGPDGTPMQEPDLIMAQHTIETLKMLRAKTRGNLEEAELQLLDNLLYELHTHFTSL